MKEYTPEEAAKQMTQFAKSTSEMSQNWENLQFIFTDFIRAAFNAGYEKGQRTRDSGVEK